MALTKARKRQLNRIRSFFRRAEKKGFSWSEEYKQQILQSSTNKLRNIKPKQLYKQAQYQTNKGKVSGTEGVTLRRKIGAKKGVETRRYKKWLKTPEGKEWLNQIEYQTVTEYQYDYLPNEGEIVYDRIMEMINQYPTKGSEILKKSLESDIKKFGYENVIKGLAIAPEYAIQSAQLVVHYSGNSETPSNEHRAYKSFFDLIRGTIPNSEDEKMIGEVLEQMGAWEVVS